MLAPYNAHKQPPSYERTTPPSTWSSHTCPSFVSRSWGFLEYRKLIESQEPDKMITFLGYIFNVTRLTPQTTK